MLLQGLLIVLRNYSKHMFLVQFLNYNLTVVVVIVGIVFLLLLFYIIVAP